MPSESWGEGPSNQPTTPVPPIVPPKPAAASPATFTIEPMRARQWPRRVAAAICVAGVVSAGYVGVTLFGDAEPQRVALRSGGDTTVPSSVMAATSTQPKPTDPPTTATPTTSAPTTAKPTTTAAQSTTTAKPATSAPTTAKSATTAVPTTAGGAVPSPPLTRSGNGMGSIVVQVNGAFSVAFGYSPISSQCPTRLSVKDPSGNELVGKDAYFGNGLVTATYQGVVTVQISPSCGDMRQYTWKVLVDQG